jgi:hypothetical protein
VNFSGTKQSPSSVRAAPLAAFYASHAALLERAVARRVVEPADAVASSLARSPSNRRRVAPSSVRAELTRLGAHLN